MVVPIIAISLVIFLLGLRLEGWSGWILSGVGASLIVSLSLATLGSTMYESPSGVFFGLIGGLFIGTYFVLYTVGTEAAVLASFISPASGAVAGYIITNKVQSMDDESYFDE